MCFRSVSSCGVLFCAAIVAALIGCGDDSETNDGGGKKKNSRLKDTGPYAAITIVGESSFFGVVPSLGTGDYNVGENVETNGMFIHAYGRRVFLIPGNNNGSDEVEVYDVAKDNAFSLAGTLPGPSGSLPGDVLVVDDDTAYISFMTTGMIWRFDPMTLEKKAEIDLTGYAVGDGDPDTPADNSPEPAGMATKDGKLYVALNQSYNQQMMGRDGMWVAVIDIESDTVDTVIEETGRGYAFAGRAGGAEEAIFFDENGDLYVIAMASWGWAPGQTAGILRIRDGEETFDPDWEFMLTGAEFTKGKETLTAAYILQAFYAGDGILYASLHIPDHLKDEPDWVNDRAQTTVEIDLYNDTIEALPLPDTNNYCSDILVDGDLMVTSVFSGEGAGIYAYDIENEKVVGKPAVEVEGMLHMMALIEGE